MAAAALTGGGECGRDPDGAGGAGVPVEPCRRHPGRDLHRQPVVCRFAVKPTSSILTRPGDVHVQAGAEVDLITKGRHDPCVGIRAVPVGEAMMACVLLDHLLLDRGR